MQTFLQRYLEAFYINVLLNFWKVLGLNIMLVSIRGLSGCLVLKKYLAYWCVEDKED